jgi:hypothetical protein
MGQWDRDKQMNQLIQGFHVKNQHVSIFVPNAALLFVPQKCGREGAQNIFMHNNKSDARAREEGF